MISKFQSISEKERYIPFEANLLARFIYLSQSSQMRLFIEPEITWFTTDIAYPHYVFNVALRANFAALETAHAYISQLKQDAQTRRMSLFWAVGPVTQPSDFGQYLVAHQFQLALKAKAMQLDLARLNETIAIPADFRVVRVATPAQLREFIRVQSCNSDLPADAAEAWFNLEADIGLGDHLAWQRYLGYWRGEPVATASTITASEVVGLYQVATLPQARGFGLGTAISLAAMRDARQRGQCQAILHSTELGFNVYRRLGFEPVTDVDIYLWSGANHNDEG